MNESICKMGRFAYHEVPDGEETELDIYSNDRDHTTCSEETNTTTVGFPLHMNFAAQSYGTPALVSSADEGSLTNNCHNQADSLIYQQSDFNRYETNGNKKRGNYVKHICFLLVILLLQLYVPPPPPPNQSWAEFVARSTERCLSTTKIVYNLAIYISYGCIQNMYRDLRYNNFFAPKKDGESHRELCAISLPSLNAINDENQNLTSPFDHGYSERLENELMSRIAAQDLVMKNIVQSLKSWNDHEYNVKNISNMQPLSIMLTGPRGVGKYETALSIAEILLNQCSSSSDSRILTLQGMDFALDDTETSGGGKLMQNRLVEKILYHIYIHGGTGVVIIIKHMENISSRDKQELMHLIHQSNIRYTPPSENRLDISMNQNWHSKNSLLGENPERETVEIYLGGSAIIATSDIGTDKMFKVLLKKEHGLHDDSTYKDVEKAIVADFETYFDGKQNHFHIIAPFWPLRYWDMGKVLHKIVNRKINDSNNFKSIDMGESATSHLINPHNIDYIEFKLKDGSYLFSKGGGHDLIEYQAIVGIINDVISTKSFYSLDDRVVVEYDGSDLFMKVCSGMAKNNEKIFCSPETIIYL